MAGMPIRSEVKNGLERQTYSTARLDVTARENGKDAWAEAIAVATKIRDYKLAVWRGDGLGYLPCATNWPAQGLIRSCADSCIQNEMEDGSTWCAHISQSACDRFFVDGHVQNVLNIYTLNGALPSGCHCFDK